MNKKVTFLSFNFVLKQSFHFQKFFKKCFKMYKKVCVTLCRSLLGVSRII